MLSPTEEMLYHCHNMGRMIIRYSVRLCSKKILEEEHVRSAVIHLQRKVPTLRLCIRTKEDGTLWFLTRDNEAVDFQIGDAANYDTEQKDILYRQFNVTDGPLWRASLFPCQQEKPFLIDHLTQEYPQQYNLLFGFQHSITDGTSNIKICSLVTAAEENDILEEVSSILNQNDDQLQFLRSFYERVENLDLPILRLYPSVFPETPSIETIYYDMSEKETKEFTSKCKLEGVTVNSALCTAINAALVDLVKGSGPHKESYEVSHLQLINLRRYLKQPNEFPIGHCVCSAAMVSLVPVDVVNAKTFWKMARIFNEEMSNVIQNKFAYKQVIINIMNGFKDLKKVTSEDLSYRLNCSYVTSNCGNLNKIFNGEGEHVQATHLKRCTSVTKLVSVHEFRNRLHYSLDYAQEYISRLGDQLWCDSIFEILQQVV